MGRLRPIAALVALVSLGCAADFDPAWDVKTFRVFGAQVTNVTRATSDPRAAEAAPGEEVRVSLASLDPSPTPRPLNVAWLFCPQTARAGSSFGCGDPATTIPRMGADVTFPIPDVRYGTDPFGRARIQGIALACAGGTPGFDPATMQPRCDGAGAESVTMLRSVIVRVNETSDVNHNPELTGAVLYLGGDTRNPVTLGAEAPARIPRCTTDPCPEHVIELQVSPASRETYRTLDIRGMPVTQPERLQFGFYFVPPATALRAVSAQRERGGFEGTFFVDTAERPNGPVRKKWSPPATAGTVTFLFNVQDIRGGFDTLRRTVTVE